MCNIRLCILIGLSVQCLTMTDKDWWKTATFYQIYPKSFKDSNGDGIGDLNGVIEKLDYIKDLGVTGIWLSPIFKSPQKDQGYDISDYRDIDPQFGTLETFKTLLTEAHNRGLKVILDYVPNHTSNEHEWFKKSVNGEKGYEDYYIWRSGKEGSKTVPPNNWISNFKHSAWEWNETRQKFYLHQFLKEQPDLNYRNPAVRQEMKNVLTYWLDNYKVDGVRMDAVPFLIENEEFKDEPRSNADNVNDVDYEYLDHIYTLNQPETYDVIYEWRSHIDSISNQSGETKICMSEAVESTDEVIPYYGTADGSKLGAHFSFNFILLLKLKSTSTANDLSDLIKEWLQRLPTIYTSNWVLGNHDNHRVASRLGTEKVDLLNILTGFLPGIQVTYNGEEIGMEDGEVTCEEGQDLKTNCTLYPTVSRDFERTPMQWDNSKFAGFTDGSSTWLPVSYKKDQCNVKDQLEDPKSHLNIFKQIQKLRTQLRDQTEIDIQVKESNVLEIERFNLNKENELNVFKMVLNYGQNKVSLPISSECPFEVALSSGNSPRNPGDVINENLLELGPFEALILKSNIQCKC